MNVPERFRRRRPGLYSQAKQAAENVNRLTAQIADPAFLPILGGLVALLAAAVLILTAIVLRLVADDA
jgi:hypothetical protein